ncbi:MAG: type II secretion system F family protein [Chthoniobacteraceae bacterium]
MCHRTGIVHRMHSSEKASLFHELGQLVRTGTPFPKAIEKLTRLSGGQARTSLVRIRKALDGGASVGESLLAGIPLISSLEACVFTASERAGRLEHGLEEASQYHAALAGARARMRSRLAYPIFVIHFALLILPLPIAFSPEGGMVPFLKAAGATIGGLWLCVFIIAAVIRSSISAAEKSVGPDHLLRTLPLFGKLRRDFALGRFCSAYHMQLNAGVNVLASLETSGAASGSAVLRDAILAAMPAVRAGGQVGAALEKTRAFPEPFLRAFAVGEETGELDRELQRIGEKYRETAMRRLETIAEWVPRLIYLSILLFIAWRIIGAQIGRMRDIQKVMEQ